MTKLLGKNIFSLAISKVVSGLVMFAVYTRLVNYLGPEDYGRFSLVFAYLMIALLLVDMGASRYVIKKVSEDKTASGTYLSNFFIVQLLLATVILGIIALIPYLMDYEPSVRKAMFLAGIGVFLLSFSIPFSSIVQAWQRISVLAWVIFLNSLLNAAWLGISIFLGKDWVFFFLVYTVIGVFNLILYAFVAGKIVAPVFKIDRPLMRKLFVYGVPFGMLSGFEILIAKIDVVIQKFFLPFSEVGLYSASYRFLDFFGFLPAIVSISLFPYLSEQKDLADPETKKVMERLNRFMLALAIPVGLVTSIFARPIILLLFGVEYEDSILILQILIWSSVITFIYAVPYTIVILKKTKIAIFALAAVTVLNAMLNFILVPRFGIVASAWITVGSSFLTGILYVISAKKIASFKLFGFLRREDLAFVKSFFKG